MLVLSIKGELVPTFPYLDNPNAPNAGHYRYTADLINVNLIGTDLAFWLGLGGGGSGGGSSGGELVATSGGGVPNAGPLGPTPLTSGGVNIQTTSYTAVAADNGKIISVNAAGATTLTLPAAPPFAQWNIFVENIGAGTLTVSPNGLNLDGSASSITVGTNQGTYISTDGTNYFTGTRGLGLVNPMTTKGDVIVGGTSGAPARLAVGTNGQVLTANSAATNGLDYEAPIALTTTGTSGAASLTPGNPYTLNVPQYSGGGGGSISAGTFAALPGSPTSGQLYLFTDSIYDYAIFQSSAWIYMRRGQALTPPTGFAWQNQSTATLTTANGGENILSATGAGASNVNARYIAYPSAPFTRTVGCLISFIAKPGQAPLNNEAGLFLSDGTKMLGFGVYFNTAAASSSTISLSYQSGPTLAAFTANVFTQAPILSQFSMVWFRMDDGVTSASKRTLFISLRRHPVHPDLPGIEHAVSDADAHRVLRQRQLDGHIYDALGRALGLISGARRAAARRRRQSTKSSTR